MTADAFITAQLPLFAWQRGQTNSQSGMLAAAFVIRNRVRAGWYGGAWLDVIANDHLVSANDDSVLDDRFFPDTREPAFRRLLQSVDSIFDGSEEDPMTKGALYFAELNNVTREWFKTNIIARQEEHWRIAQVGTLTLFT
jgi:spore germination cell wall hydrolase CwlJ-like protein